MLLRSWLGIGDPASGTKPRISAPPAPEPLVCARHYQDAIAQARPGDRVYLVREHGNPYDAAAIAAVDTERATLGLIARDSDLHRRLLSPGEGCVAWIEKVTRGPSGMLGVTLMVEPADAPIGSRPYRRPARVRAGAVLVQGLV